MKKLTSWPFFTNKFAHTFVHYPRYQRSLDLLMPAVQSTNRAYIFDNSTHEHIWLAEITNGNTLEMKTDQIPAWFKRSLWDKLKK